MVPLLLLAHSCISENEEVIISNSDFDTNNQFENVDISLLQAVENANFIYRDIDGDRPRVRRISDVRLITTSDLSRSNQATRSSSEDDGVVYIVNYENNDGYAILAADEQLPPVIMIGDEGNFSTDDFIEYINNNSNTRSEEGGESPEELQYELIGNSLLPQLPSLPVTGGRTDTTIILKCLPLVKTKWGQGQPYNMYAVENGVTCKAGCLPVAISQTLAALCYRHNFRPTARIHEDYTIDWKTINRQIFQDSIRYSHETPGAQAAATLIRAVGVEIDAEYGTSITEAYPTEIVPLFQKIGITDAQRVNNNDITDIEIFDMIVNHNYPVLCDAYTIDNSSSTGYSGHAFVLDGWVRLQYTTILLGASTIGGNQAENDYRQDTFDLVHVNFGWSGACDGYYLLNAFDVSSNEFDDYNEDDDIEYNLNYKFNLNVNYTTYNL